MFGLGALSLSGKVGVLLKVGVVEFGRVSVRVGLIRVRVRFKSGWG